MLFRRFLLLLSCSLMLCWISATQAATFRDSLGRSVTLNSPARRIVSLAPNLTEILYSLGLGDRVVGVTQFSYYPPEAAQKPKVGSYANLNVEGIISLSPDLAIGTADGNMPGVIKLLEQAGIPVYVVNPRRVRDVIETIERLGELCDVPEKAKSLCSRLDRRVSRILEKTARLRRPLVFFQINERPIMSVNKNTFHHDVIHLAGGVNMAQDEPLTYPRISVEEVLRRKPEVIIISSMGGGERYERVRGDWLKWSGIPAVKSRRVHLVDSDLLDRPSPRIVKGLETVAKLIHPEVEWD